MNEDTSGFYRLYPEGLFYGKIVYGVNGGDLLPENKDNYSYPMGNWYWFDSILEANQFFGIQPEEQTPMLPPANPYD